MDKKLMFSIIGRPWFIAPGAAQVYADMAFQLFQTGSIPDSDKRKFYGDGSSYDFNQLFRVNEQGAVSRDGIVQVIRLNYPIAKYDYCGDAGSQTLTQFIRAANADTSIKSIVLWIDSPGGQVDGTEALAQSVKNSAKPIVAYSDGMLCSAAYWIGSSAREVIVNGANKGWNATVGSIGTMVRWADDSAKLEREGVKVHFVTATASKDKWGDYIQANAGNYDSIIKSLDGINDSFLSAIKLNRSGKIDLTVEDVLTGKTYNASDALKYGLVDKIADFQYAVKRSLFLAKSGSSDNNSTKTSMKKFELTQSAAKATEEFDVLNDGEHRWLTEEHLSNIESTLQTHEANATASRKKIDDLTAENQTLTTSAANSVQKIAELESQIETLKKQDAGEFAAPGSTKEDDFEAAGEIVNDPKLGVNQYIDSLLK